MDIEAITAVYALQDKQGFVSTKIPGVSFFWSRESVACAPIAYDAGIVIVVQGDKVGYLDGDEFRYDRDHYLVLSVPLTFECATQANPDHPLMGIFLHIDHFDLHEIAEVLCKHSRLPALHASSVRRGVEPVSMDAPMRSSVQRLLDCLCVPEDCEILGRSLAREVLYRAFLGSHGGALYALTQRDTHYSRIAGVVRRIHRDFASSLSVEDLSGEVLMSHSAFHRAFKQVTGCSPLQYIKAVRLHKARALLVSEKLSAKMAAARVGYSSASQFSREFKRHFKVTPARAKHAGYLP